MPRRAEEESAAPPRAAATSSRSPAPSRPRAATNRATVDRRGARRGSRSRSLTARVLIPARSASCSWVIAARSRRPRSVSPNDLSVIGPRNGGSTVGSRHGDGWRGDSTAKSRQRIHRRRHSHPDPKTYPPGPHRNREDSQHRHPQTPLDRRTRRRTSQELEDPRPRLPADHSTLSPTPSAQSSDCTFTYRGAEQASLLTLRPRRRYSYNHSNKEQCHSYHKCRARVRPQEQTYRNPQPNEDRSPILRTRHSPSPPHAPVCTTCNWVLIAEDQPSPSLWDCSAPSGIRPRLGPTSAVIRTPNVLCVTNCFVVCCATCLPTLRARPAHVNEVAAPARKPTTPHASSPVGSA